MNQRGRFDRVTTLAVVGLIGCAPNAEPSQPRAEVEVPAPSAAASSTSAPMAGAPAPRIIADSARLEAGRVEFVGIVRPTKGGLDVRGVTFSLEELEPKLSPKRWGSAGYDALLGAKLRVVAELVAEHTEARPDGAPIVQSRSGDFFRASKLIHAEVVAEPVLIEGEVARSKGFYSVGEHLVSREDLGWSLVGQGGEVSGKRVRLWGQPRVVVCDPNAQCLTSGSLPMFDVARAELVK